MDKQKLITIVKDQLQGGIAEEQVRDLLTYRGVEQGDVDAIMQEALGGVQRGTDLAGDGDIVAKTDAALKDISQDPPIDPGAMKRERKILIGSIVGAIVLAIAGSVLYFVYF